MFRNHYSSSTGIRNGGKSIISEKRAAVDVHEFHQITKQNRELTTLLETKDKLISDL